MSNLQSLFILFTISNSILYINTQYVKVSPPSTVRGAALKRSYSLICQYTGMDESGQFHEWFREIGGVNKSVRDEKPGHYVVKHTDKNSTLTIKIFVQADADVEKWFVVTKKAGFEKPAACQFGNISFISSPQSIEDNAGERIDVQNGSLRRTEGQSLTLRCIVDSHSDNGEKSITWEYSKDGKHYGSLDDSMVNANAAEIQIGSVQKYHRGYYRCVVNDISFAVLLRVKDRLAALWPFLGIVAVVVVLVIIILIFEKRQKSNKKLLSNDEDDQDQANDPLVRTTTRPADNDTKKRAVKA